MGQPVRLTSGADGVISASAKQERARLFRTKVRNGLESLCSDLLGRGHGTQLPTGRRKGSLPILSFSR